MSSPTAPRSSRRRFLKWSALGVFGSLAVLGGGAFALVRPGGKAAGRKALADSEVRFLEAAAEAYFPPGNSLGLDVTTLHVGATVDEILAGFPSFERNVVRGLFNLFDSWPRLSLASTGSFAQLSLERRIQVLRDFDSSGLQPRRGLGEALRAVLGLAVFSRPEALQAVGHVNGCGTFA